MCKNFVWNTNGMVFVHDVLLIQIRSCDMVLGIQWLKQLGEVHWEFHNMTIRFEMEGQPVCVKGVTINVRVQVV